MNRQIPLALGIAALATGGLLVVAGAAHADTGSSNGNRFTYIDQHTTTICGNAIAINAVVHNHCGAYSHDHTGYQDADLDAVDGILNLDLDYDGSDVDDDAGQWFHIDSRTWS
jgi:hypothetical protein